MAYYLFFKSLLRVIDFVDPLIVGDLIAINTYNSCKLIDLILFNLKTLEKDRNKNKVAYLNFPQKLHLDFLLYSNYLQIKIETFSFSKCITSFAFLNVLNQFWQ